MRSWLLLVALIGCAPAPVPTVCNGHAELCGRAYDAVAYPGAHDSYSNRANGFAAADQTYTLTRQLADGIRVLHFEIIPDNGEPYLCHGICGLGGEALKDGFAEVVTFLQANPNEVVTLLTESSQITTDQIASAASDAGLLGYVHAHALSSNGQAWPTLGAMIQRGERVVFFHADMSASGGTAFDWMLDRFAWTWETPWNNQVASDFARCDADRGTKGNDLYVVDTYLEDVTFQTAAHAALVNDDPFLLDRVLWCKQTEGVMPSFVMVNYYEVGELFHTVDVLNGLAAPPAGLDASVPPAAFADAGP